MPDLVNTRDVNQPIFSMWFINISWNGQIQKSFSADTFVGAALVIKSQFFRELIKLWCSLSKKTWSGMSFTNLAGTLSREIICFVLVDCCNCITYFVFVCIKIIVNTMIEYEFQSFGRYLGLQDRLFHFRWLSSLNYVVCFCLQRNGR